jgi:glycerol-3-phosphate acyltransferase PlsX
MPDITVAVDAMGGDHAPAATVDGAVQAASRARVRIVLVGEPAAIEAELGRHDTAARGRVEVVEAPDVISMDEAPLAALRRKPKASIRVAVELVASGRADAVFTAGHTGAALIAAHSALGVLPGAERPALAVTIPTRAGASVLVDAGANADCRPEHLEQFAVMGSAYARVALDIDDPAVGLLSIGAEAGKGNDLIREAHARLEEAAVRFIGNLEARDIFTGRAHVIVCDGFTGNVALKVAEGLVEAIEDMLGEEFDLAASAGGGAGEVESAFSRFRRRVDYAQYGGAPLLGVGGLVVVGHGHSSATAIENGVVTAVRLAGGHVVDRLAVALTGAA